MTDLFGLQTTLPCLSLWEPWASLIVAGVKHHETRHWPTKVRGRVAIHAAKRCERDVGVHLDDLCSRTLGPDWPTTRPAGCVVAVAELTACRRAEDVWDEWEQASIRGGPRPEQRSDHVAGNFGPGRFAFRLVDVRPLREPLPLLGRQGFFRWTTPADLEARLLPPVDQAAAAERWEMRS